MPRIPKAGPGRGIPGVTRTAGGAVSGLGDAKRAEARMIETVGKAGAALANTILDHKNTVDTNDAVLKYRMNMNKHEIELKRQAIGNDDATSAYLDNLNKKQDEEMKAATDGLSFVGARMFRGKIEDERQRALVRGQTNQNLIAIGNFTTKRTNLSDEFGSDQSLNPNKELVAEYLTNDREKLNSVSSGDVALLNTTTADKEYRKEQHKQVGNLVRGYVNNGQFNQAAEVLNQGSGIMEGFDPKIRAQLQKMVKGAQKQRLTLGKAEFQKQRGDLISAGRDGEDISEEARAFMAKSQIFNATKPDKVKRDMIDLTTAIAEGNVLKDLERVSEEERPAIIAKFESDLDAVKEKLGVKSTFGHKEISDAKSRLEAKAVTLDREQKKRPVKAVDNILQDNVKYQTLKKRAEAGDLEAARQLTETRLRVQGEVMKLDKVNQRTSSREETKVEGDRLMQPNSNLASQRISELKVAKGENFPKFMQEMFDDNVLDERFYAITYARPEVQAQLISNLKEAGGPEGINASFKGADNRPTKFVEDRDLNKAVKDYSDGFIRDDPNASNIRFVGAYKEMIRLNARARFLRNGNYSKSLEEATAMVYGDAFNIVESGNSKAIAPKVISNSKGKPISFNPDIADSFLSVYKDADNLRALSLPAPKHYTPEQWYDTLEDRGKWQINNAMDGYILYLDGNVVNRIVDGKSQNAEIKFTEMMGDQRVLDDVAGIFGKLQKITSPIIRGVGQTVKKAVEGPSEVEKTNKRISEALEGLEQFE